MYYISNTRKAEIDFAFFSIKNAQFFYAEGSKKMRPIVEVLIRLSRIHRTGKNGTQKVFC